MTEEVTPSKTIYINNLNEKVKKQELRKSLYAMFSQFGTVLDVVALKTLHMRGQAFIVFKDLAAATAARRAMSNFPFYDKPMHIQFAKTKSDVIAKIEGTYEPRAKTVNPVVESQKRKAEQATANEVEKKAKITEEREKTKGDKKRGDKSGPAAAPQIVPERPGSINPPKAEVLPPNKILFVQNLPEGCTDMALSMLFQQFPGFKEVRIVPAKGQTVAFVEFDNEDGAGVALQGLQGFKVTPQYHMVISFAKK